MSKQITVPYEKITVTPQMAADWIENQQTNRKLRLPIASIIADEIKEGNWLVNHFYNPIKFNKSGKMIDGQHRCKAIIIANIPVETFVQYNVSKEEAERIDSSCERNFVDKEALNGISRIKEVVAASFMASSSELYSKTSGTPAVIRKAYKDFGAGADYAHNVLFGGSFTYPLMAAVAKAYHEKNLDRKKVMEFTIALRDGDKIQQATDIRNLLIYKKEIAKAVNNRVKLFLITYRAIVDYCQGRERSVKEIEFNLRPSQLRI